MEKIMKKTSGVIRLLCAAIDGIIVAFPVIFIMVKLFGVSDNQAELLMKLLFAVYGVLFMEYMNGATPAKKLGKIRVVSLDGSKPSLMEYGMRELVKSLYFIPLIGWVLFIISSIMMFTGSGRTLHDKVASTRVVYVWDKSLEMDEQK
jgi:uncharacterized RDD family membrane protein YckC